MARTRGETMDNERPLILAIAGLAYSDGECFELLKRALDRAQLDVDVQTVPAAKAVDDACRRKPVLIVAGHRPLQTGSSEVAGTAVIKALKKHPQTQRIPVLLVEALSDIEQVAKACGADAHLQLPVDAGAFVDAVRKLVSDDR